MLTPRGRAPSSSTSLRKKSLTALNFPESQMGNITPLDTNVVAFPPGLPAKQSQHVISQIGKSWRKNAIASIHAALIWKNFVPALFTLWASVSWCFVHVCFVQVKMLNIVWCSRGTVGPRCAHFSTDICCVIQEGLITVEKCAHRGASARQECHMLSLGQNKHG